MFHTVTFLARVTKIIPWQKLLFLKSGSIFECEIFTDIHQVFYIILVYLSHFC